MLACYLSTKPDIRLRLFEELKTVMPSDDTVPQLQQLERLPYLTAVIHETLRLGHPLSHRLLRSYPDRVLRYGGMEIPPGTSVGMTAVLIHTNPDIFPRPEEFLPERWLGDDKQKLKHYLVPFSRGTRGCIGINLAYAELYLSVALIYRRYKLELQDTIEERDWRITRDLFHGAPAVGARPLLVKVLAA